MDDIAKAEVLNEVHNNTKKLFALFTLILLQEYCGVFQKLHDT